VDQKAQKLNRLLSGCADITTNCYRYLGADNKPKKPRKRTLLAQLCPITDFVANFPGAL